MRGGPEARPVADTEDSELVSTGSAKTSIVDRLEDSLRERILSGSYAPGSRLVLARLAEEHGVSFIPVREALHRLESERLVCFELHRGARVAEISIADMRDIYETRVVLEQHAIRAAIPATGDGELARADRALDEMEAGFAAGRERQAFAAHQEFHFSLYEPAGSAWTMHSIRQLWASAERYVRLAVAVRPAPKLFVGEHREIFEAVVQGDIEAAVESLRANLLTTERLLTENYEGVPHRVE